MQISEDSDFRNNNIFNTNLVSPSARQTLNYDQTSILNFSDGGAMKENFEPRKFDVDLTNDPILQEYNNLMNDYIQKFGIDSSSNKYDPQKMNQGVLLLDRENKVFWADRFA